MQANQNDGHVQTHDASAKARAEKLINCHLPQYWSDGDERRLHSRLFQQIKKLVMQAYDPSMGIGINGIYYFGKYGKVYIKESIHG